MNTKIFYGIEFKVYSETKIEGDFIKENEAVYFENDVEITGNLKVKYLKTKESIKVSGSYEVEKFDEVGKWQEVGGWQKVGGSQEVDEWQKVGGSQEVGKWQEVGGSQEVGGNLIAESSKVSLFSIVKGKYEVAGKVFIGVCEWRKTDESEETLTCGKFISGEIKYGKLKEIGLDDKPQEINFSGKEIEIKIDGKNYKAIIK